MAKKITTMFKSYVFDGILLIALGIAMLIWPEESLKIPCIIIGAVLAIMGIIKIIAFIAKKTKGSSGLFVGLAQIAIGAAFIFASDFFISVFHYVIAFILLYGAIMMFINAFNLRKVFGMMFMASLIFAIITTILAIVIIINPFVFVQLRGIALIIEGLAMVIVLRTI
ncbi:MAG: DUF308 domain-containing protein [Clostridia bacterium]|nr:DUF308 domain-containing protein [Clostridia bacterium]